MGSIDVEYQVFHYSPPFFFFLTIEILTFWFWLHFGFTSVILVLLINRFGCTVSWFIGAWKVLKKLYLKLLITKLSCNVMKPVADQQVSS